MAKHRVSHEGKAHVKKAKGGRKRHSKKSMIKA
jgi:uncharacterized protein Veg